MRGRLCLTVDKLVLTGLVALRLAPQVELCEFKGEDLTEEEDGGNHQGNRGSGGRLCQAHKGAVWRVRQ